MCKDCGCQEANRRLREQWAPSAEPLRFHPKETRTLTLEQKVLQKNDSFAEKNRDWFNRNGIRVVS